MNIKNKNSEFFTVLFMMAATVSAKLLGALRGIIMAHSYGTNIEAQAFSEASHIPLTLFDLAFGAAILGCFIPIYNSFGHEKEKADHFAVVFLDFILLGTGIFALLGIIFADSIINLMASGLDGEVRILAARLLRIMFPIVIFTGSTYTLIGILQSKGKYMLPAAVSAISNAVVILYLLLLDPLLGNGGIYGLSIAYILSWIVQLLTLAVPLVHSGFSFKFRFEPKNPALISALKTAPSVMFGSWLSPVSVLCGLYFAAFIDFEGAVSIFDYSNAVFVIIAGTLTYSICNYCFPILSKSDGDEWFSLISKGFTAAFQVILPFTAATLILAGEGVSVLYLSGEFTSSAAREVASVLRSMATAMPAFVIVELASRIFYSKKLSRIPAYAAFTGIAVNIISSSVFVRHGINSVNSVGKGFSSGLYAAAAVMVIFLFREARPSFNIEFLRRLFITAAASVISFAAMYILYKFFGNDPYSSGKIKNIIIAAITALCGGTVYLALQLVTRNLSLNKKEKSNKICD